ncbi:MAG: SusD/RagB family nutrient-binding outer membrane lipoprotein [Gemmatimonadaceae bacterium]
MKNIKRTRVAAGMALIAALSACSDYLTTPDALSNPNNPTSATNQQRLTGVETNVTALLTGDIARTIALFMNQYAGTDRQYFNYASYQVGEDFTNGGFATIYGGGGVIDLRAVQSNADAAGDSTTAGIARVLEGVLVATAADFWGDVPYKTAFDPSTKATLDPQATVYAAAQALFDRGIKQLQSNAGSGPGAADLFYTGDRSKWIAAAYTLKARYLLHTAERAGFTADGTPNFDPAVYTAAIAAAQNGIASAANDLRSYQSTAQTESNLLYQFAYQQRAGYASPHKYFVDLLTSRSDPRLTQYFSVGAGTTTILGAIPGNGGPAGTIAGFNQGTGGIANPSYRWRMVSSAENQLIIAEAQFRLGNVPAALTAFNSARTSAGLTAAVALPAGAAGLQEIMTEKYIALVQNPEIWNDYKRTCFPPLTPTGATANKIPSRFLYPDAERNANSDNIPVPGSQPARNTNDPNPCLLGTRQVTA